MKLIKLIRIFFCLVIYILLALGINIFVRDRDHRLRALSFLNHDLAVTIKRILNIEIELEPKTSLLKNKGDFIISNHLSYVDGIVLGSIFKVIYVSKLQVKSWPFFGVVANLGGTVFIDREKKLSLEYITRIKELLDAGVNILLFPEGTSTAGSEVLPFQPLFFSSPIQAQADILPLGIAYTHINGREIKGLDKDKVHWYGQVPFFYHLWNLLAIKSLRAKVTIHSKIKTSGYKNNALSRHRLADIAHHIITGARI
ncbi:MAG: 1-acyl-sn-glycerol-3-phosphate acyltransferase [Candidatus Omnitrophica bacterium]|nr:1-acyl-sn-glycerol-3-phosphate acyltransferase [Candidatus Omnitrophota bacterium]